MREGTRQIYRFAPGGAAYEFTPVGDFLFFTADDGVHGRELWLSDGTPEGTAMVADLRPGPLGAFDSNQAYPYLREYNGEVYFAADDGEHGTELWASSPGRAGFAADVVAALLASFHGAGGVVKRDFAP